MSYSPFEDSPEYHESIAYGNPEPQSHMNAQTQKGFHLEPDPFMTGAFKNGRACRLAGILPSTTPQEATSYSQAWMLGWKSVKADSVGRGNEEQPVVPLSQNPPALTGS